MLGKWLHIDGIVYVVYISGISNICGHIMKLAIYVFQNGNGRNKMVINEMSLVRYVCHIYCVCCLYVTMLHILIYMLIYS